MPDDTTCPLEVCERQNQIETRPEGELHERAILLRKPNGMLIDVTASVDEERAQLREVERERDGLRARVDELEATVDRTNKANDILQRALQDLDVSYNRETCPRVQCQGAARSLRKRVAELEAECVSYLDICRTGIATAVELDDAKAGWARDLRDLIQCRDTLHRIASMPIEPRANGTHNHDRAALIYMAEDALKGRQDD